ncbi:hypothetical protein DL96DRAFT_1711746 [Flagelloscypha sp. PMI_526]|nr:hypothetical protein DL96DRAFT_1711746 [Flagelloscypha sp. PMI_526]
MRFPVSQMPDKVYALRQLEPQNVDDLTLKPNDIIEVLERDDEFGDGWWLGMNPCTDAVGLFPQSYTTPVDAGSLEGDNDGTLTTLNEVYEPSTTPPPTTKPLVPLLDPAHDRRPSVSSSLVNARKANQGEVQLLLHPSQTTTATPSAREQPPSFLIFYEARALSSAQLCPAQSKPSSAQSFGLRPSSEFTTVNGR